MQIFIRPPRISLCVSLDISIRSDAGGRRCFRGGLGARDIASSSDMSSAWKRKLPLEWRLFMSGRGTSTNEPAPRIRRHVYIICIFLFRTASFLDTSEPPPRKSSIWVFTFVQAGIWHSQNLIKTLIYVSCFSLEGLWVLFGGSKPTKAPPWRRDYDTYVDVAEGRRGGVLVAEDSDRRSVVIARFWEVLKNAVSDDRAITSMAYIYQLSKWSTTVDG